ncbi:MAG: c-type cytochrome [Gemmatimonadaceae bacterium]
MTSLRNVILMVLAPGCLVACGSAKRDEPEKPAFVPANATIARGEQVFKKQCDYCHPGGGAGLGPPLNNKPAPAFAIRFQIRHGLGAMPSFDSTKIREADVRAIAEYLLALRRSD